MGSGDQLAVVSFAETAAVEQSPQASKFTGFSAEVGHDASRLADALDLALSLVGKDESGRILAAVRRPMDRPRRLRLGRPGRRRRHRHRLSGRRTVRGRRPGHRAGPGARQSVLPGESFMITAWIDSPLAQTSHLPACCRGDANDRRGHDAPSPPAPAGCCSATRPRQAAPASTRCRSTAAATTRCRATTGAGCSSGVRGDAAAVVRQSREALRAAGAAGQGGA